MPPPVRKPATNITAPMTALTMMNWRFDQLRPACAMRIGKGRFFAFFSRSSSSLSVSSTCSRRTFGPARPAATRAAGSERVMVSWRRSAFRSPDRIG